jgi:hypothetical protein
MLFITQGKTNWKFLLIVIILAVIVGGMALICQLQEMKFIELPKIKKSITSKEFTLSLDKEAKIIYEFDKQREEFVLSLKEIDLSAGKTMFLKHCFLEPEIKLEKESTCFVTEEGGAHFKLIKLEENKATFETWFRIGEPHPLGPFAPKEIIITKSLEKTGCDWRPTKDLGPCLAIQGVYYNGEKCVVISGCGRNGEAIPFQTMEECKTLCEETADWKTYRSEKYNYEVRYPNDWVLDEKIKETVTLNSPENEKIRKDIEAGKVYGEGYMRDIIISYYSSVSEEPENKANKFGAVTIDELIQRDILITPLGQITFAGEKAYEVSWGGFIATYSILVEKNNHLYKITFGNRDKSELTETEKQILSTFRFIETSPQTAPSPSIDSISPNSGPIGTIIEIRGKNFSGFEGDLDAWIENTEGVKGIIYGEMGSNGNLIRFTLKSSFCQIDTSYSGLPCPNFIYLTPGIYKIYVTPWWQKSNEVTFTITPS